MITGQLRNDIDRLWETFWTGGISNPLTVIEQITYLLFIKRMDDIQIRKENMANRLGTAIEEPIFTPEEKPLRWSSFKQEEPQVMLDRFRKPLSKELDYTVFDKMKTMGNADSAFREFMKGATFMIDKARLLDKAVQMLDEIDQADQDTKGDLYEYLLSKIATAGQNGQFRTPRHIIRMMVDMVQPTPDDTICDPSAGTMGFLVACIEYLREHHKDEFFKPEFKAHFNGRMFTGLEFDPSMIRIGAMNLMLHGLESPNLHLEDSLSEQAGGIRDAYSLILANPPFKGSLDKEAVDSSIISVVDSKKTELLFLGLMLRMLKIGGRCAVIVPDGVLFGSSNAHQQIRKEIIERHQLQGVVSMPGGVFKPYAGVSTAILFFTKTNSGGTDQVWFYDMKADGFSLDDKRSPLGDRHEENNIPDIVEKWRSWQVLVGSSTVGPKGVNSGQSGARTSQCFLVPVQEIRDNDYDLSINRYKQVEYNAVDYAPPAEVIAHIEKLDEKRNALLAQLKGLLLNSEIFEG
ncbi:MAG: SAM-dependent DNA methyltransferase [Saprospiraceae bacterium]|nr:SAM-dependent DNA methyltransferase [Saprospiraceae bacterium]